MSKEAQEKLLDILRKINIRASAPGAVAGYEVDAAIKELADQLTTDEQTAYEERMGEGA